jgi:hypothetical protein
MIIRNMNVMTTSQDEARAQGIATRRVLGIPIRRQAALED